MAVKALPLKRIFAALLSLAAAMSLPACYGRRYKPVEDYTTFISSLYRYEAVGGEEDVPPAGDVEGETTGGGEGSGEGGSELPPTEEVVAPDAIDGLGVIGDKFFSAGPPFFGSYAYVFDGDKSYLLGRDGTLEELPSDGDVPDDTEIVEMRFDKIIVKNNGKYGVLDPFGEVLAEAKYSEISLGNRVFAAGGNGSFDIFIDGVKTHTVSARSVTVPTDDFVVIDNVYKYADDLTPVKIGEYDVVSEPFDGVVMIMDENNRYGYATYPAGEIIHAPTFFMGGIYASGFVAVNDEYFDLDSGIYYDYPRIVSDSGETVFDFDGVFPEYKPSGIRVTRCSGGVCVFNLFDSYDRSAYGFVDLLKENREVTLIDFIPYLGRVFGRYLLSRGVGGGFYSVDEKRIVSDEYTEIMPAAGMYAVRHPDATWAILTGDLTSVADGFDLVEVYDDLLMTVKNKKFAYYSVTLNPA